MNMPWSVWLQLAKNKRCVTPTQPWCIQHFAEARRQHGDMWNEPPTSDQLVPPVTVEFANIRAALEWLDRTEKLTEVARLAGSSLLVLA